MKLLQLSLVMLAAACVCIGGFLSGSGATGPGVILGLFLTSLTSMGAFAVVAHARARRGKS